MTVALLSLLLVQSAPVESQPVNWHVVLSSDMAKSYEKGEPASPSNEMEAASGDMTTAQVVLTELEARFIFSVSNCSTGIRRLETRIDVPLELPVAEQIDRFRSAAIAVTSLQSACAVNVIDPFAGNFASTLTELTARNEAYRSARAKWFANRSNTNAKKRTQ